MIDDPVGPNVKTLYRLIRQSNHHKYTGNLFILRKDVHVIENYMVLADEVDLS